MASVFDPTQETKIKVPKRETDQTLVERCRRARRDRGLAVLEGFHALKHALRFGAEIDGVYSAEPEKLINLAQALASDVADDLESLVERVPSDVFSNLTPNAPETGVLTLARRPSHEADHLLSCSKMAPMVLLEAPAHLGNVGAVIRVAAAAGAAAVITTGRHDPWDPAALRGSAGLHFAQPVVRLSELPNLDRPLLAIDPEGDEIDPLTLPSNAVLAFGSERHGLSEALLERADKRLAIPMEARVSSLNLATAVAITLYAWRLGKRNS
ncbi:MAG: TrmH family RNA methyltransferase [Geminicoccaceae bacterium]